MEIWIGLAAFGLLFLWEALRGWLGHHREMGMWDETTRGRPRLSRWLSRPASRPVR